MFKLSGVDVVVSNSDALSLELDVLAVKHAQALYGLDRTVVTFLSDAYPNIHNELPPPSGFRLYKSPLPRGPRNFLIIGVPSLRNFMYDEMREFSRKVLASLASAGPHTRSLGMTLHGLGYGLDERDCFESLLSGLGQALASRDSPRDLKRIEFAEVNEGLSSRMMGYLSDVLSETGSNSVAQGAPPVSRETVFVAMPFSVEFIDPYEYGILAPIHKLGLKCERIDRENFVGDIVSEIRRRIQRSCLVIADLTGNNPNVSLEVGFAWGCGIPTLLVTRDTDDLAFDTRGQRCLRYQTARELSSLVADEVAALIQDQVF